jgi:hypothetical protein
MAINYNRPQIVTNGLVLCLDAGDVQSYSGSGTTWTDRSGNNNGVSLTNGGPTFNSDGFIRFDGVDDRATAINEYGFNTGNGTMVSFELWFKMRTLPTAQYAANGHIWGGEIGNDVVLYLNPAVDGVSKGNLNYDDTRYGDSDHFTNGGFTADTWAHWVAISDGTNNRIIHYINGQLDFAGATDSIGSSQRVKNWGGTRFALDTRWGTYSQLDLAVARQYNKALTAEEVAQNFNATRGRFGL